MIAVQVAATQELFVSLTDISTPSTDYILVVIDVQISFENFFCLTYFLKLIMKRSLVQLLDSN